MIVCLSNNADDITNSKTPKPKPKQTAINRHFEQVSEFVAILRYGLVCTDISLFARCKEKQMLSFTPKGSVLNVKNAL